MAASINPQKIYGTWDEGFALDIHTLASKFIAYDSAGNPMFETKRSDIGELMYRLKYGNDLGAADEIVALALPFLKTWLDGKRIETVIPAPFSHQRTEQPVDMIARKIAAALRTTFRADLLVKTSSGASKNQYKDVVIHAACSEKMQTNILLVDDIFQTGATLNACVDVLRRDFTVKSIYVLCISKRRKTFVYV